MTHAERPPSPWSVEAYEWRSASTMLGNPSQLSYLVCRSWESFFFWKTPLSTTHTTLVSQPIWADRSDVYHTTPQRRVHLISDIRDVCCAQTKGLLHVICNIRVGHRAR